MSAEERNHLSGTLAVPNNSSISENTLRAEVITMKGQQIKMICSVVNMVWHFVWLDHGRQYYYIPLGLKAVRIISVIATKSHIKLSFNGDDGQSIKLPTTNL